MIVHDKRWSITYFIKSVWTCCLLQIHLRVKLPCERLRFIWLELCDSISPRRKRATLNEQEIWTTARLCCKYFWRSAKGVSCQSDYLLLLWIAHLYFLYRISGLFLISLDWNHNRFIRRTLFWSMRLWNTNIRMLNKTERSETVWRILFSVQFFCKSSSICFALQHIPHHVSSNRQRLILYKTEKKHDKFIWYF